MVLVLNATYQVIYFIFQMASAITKVIESDVNMTFVDQIGILGEQ